MFVNWNNRKEFTKFQLEACIYRLKLAYSSCSYPLYLCRNSSRNNKMMNFIAILHHEIINSISSPIYKLFITAFICKATTKKRRLTLYQLNNCRKFQILMRTYWLGYQRKTFWVGWNIIYKIKIFKYVFIFFWIKLNFKSHFNVIFVTLNKRHTVFKVLTIRPSKKRCYITGKGKLEQVRWNWTYYFISF